MIDEKEIIMSDLREACKDLNQSGLLDVPLKVVGIKKTDLVNLFAEQIERLAEEGREEEVPTFSKEVYNTIFADEFIDHPDSEPEEEPEEPDKTEEEPEEAAEEPEKEEPKKKAAKPKSKKKEPASKEKSIFGHKLNTQAAALDDAYAKGASYKEAAEIAGVSFSRAKNHLTHLEVDKGLTVKELKEGVYTVVK